MPVLKAVVGRCCRSVLQYLRTLPPYAWLFFFEDALIRAIVNVWSSGVTKKNGAAGRPHLVVIATAGNGNIGDHAMLATILQNAKTTITVICNSPQVFTESLENDPNVLWVGLPNLLDKGLLARVLDAWKFHRIAQGASHVGIVGADVMDGRYFPTSSIARCSILTASQRAGQSTAVFGFSWSTEPVRSATTAIKYLGRSGSTLYVRDPVSRNRLVKQGVVNTVEVADLVFSLSGENEVACSSRERSVVVNVSGLVANEGVKAEPYVDLLDDLMNRGYSITVLPHVIRPGDSDLDAQADLRILRPPGGAIRYIDGLLDPLQVKSLVKGCQFVITGRMHLGILSLSEGVPAAIINTNGKAVGLYSLFGLPNLSVEVEELGNRSRLADTVAQIETASVACLVDIISQSLPTVVDLSNKNFSWLETDNNRISGGGYE